MPGIIQPETERLYLRQWHQDDFVPFSEMCADPKVMEFYPSLLTREESYDMAKKCQDLIAERGWGFWAIEEKESNRFIGFVGLHIPKDKLPFSPCVEIGWRIAPLHWGKGYATEAARSALRVGFEQLDLSEIVSFATVNNFKSRAVMERLKMVEDKATFEHPALPEGHELRRHCLYRLSRKNWPINNSLFI
ncbi:GNAT family N-acetyltransferase [Endozoicomonas sp. Mp262]|uniref:GNAT family N-acetyltransferase n=1 Tax=Endozoicomonas sp. Mp262 TaxID=2919499 RepID=UPI0021D83BA3